MAYELLDKLRLFDNSGSVFFETYSDEATNNGWSRAALSSDGNYIVAVEAYGSDVYLFSRDNTTPLWTFDPGLTVWDLEISDNGDYIAVAAGSKIFLLSRGSSTPIWNVEVGSLPTLAMSADGEYIVVGDQSGVSLFSRSSNTPVWTYRVEREIGGYSFTIVTFNSVAISSDGSYFVAGGSDGKVYLFSRG